jgi:hypothetical protein
VLKRKGDRQCHTTRKRKRMHGSKKSTSCKNTKKIAIKKLQTHDQRVVSLEQLSRMPHSKIGVRREGVFRLGGITRTRLWVGQ